MTESLAQILLAPDVQPKVVDDSFKLIEDQLAEKSGVGGTAVKLAYKTVNSFMPGHVRVMVERLLPGMVGQLDPYWADFNASGGSDFGDYLTKHGDEVAPALLSVTDAMAAASERPVIVKAYNTVRGGAAKHIEAALPAVGALVTKYAG
jgi:hypothetical protein